MFNSPLSQFDVMSVYTIFLRDYEVSIINLSITIIFVINLVYLIFYIFFIGYLLIIICKNIIDILLKLNCKLISIKNFNFNNVFYFEGKINKMYYVNRWDPEEEENESETFQLRNAYVRKYMAIILDKIIEDTSATYGFDWPEVKGLASEYYEYSEYKYPSLTESNNFLINHIDDVIKVMAKKDDELVEVIEKMEKVRDKKTFSKLQIIEKRNNEIKMQLYRGKEVEKGLKKELEKELKRNELKIRRLRKKDYRVVIEILHIDRQCEEMWEIRKWLKERKKQLQFENHMEFDRESVKDNINNWYADAFYSTRKHLLPPEYVFKNHYDGFDFTNADLKKRRRRL